jgi:G3E family GTPase
METDPTFLEQTDHQHDLSVTSVGIECEGSVDGDLLNAWLRTLLARRGTDIFRSKGILSIEGNDSRFVFQGVHMLLDAIEGKPWGEELRTNRLIFIGRNLDRSELESSFKACLVSEGL